MKFQQKGKRSRMSWKPFKLYDSEKRKRVPCLLIPHPCKFIITSIDSVLFSSNNLPTPSLFSFWLKGKKDRGGIREGVHFVCILIMYVLGIWSFVNGLATKRPGFLWLLYCEGERESLVCTGVCSTCSSISYSLPKKETCVHIP